ncbi:hypothetical protein NKH77_09620 [Streptomyces sp. M19]
MKSAAARRIFDETLAELLDGRLRFQWMHPACASTGQPSRSWGSPTAPCALRAQRQAVAAGLTVRTRRGRFLGVLDAEHSWLEVLDEDDVWKPVDPVFALLSIRHDRARKASSTSARAPYPAGSCPGRCPRAGRSPSTAARSGTGPGTTPSVAQQRKATHEHRTGHARRTDRNAGVRGERRRRRRPQRQRHRLR